MATARKPKDQDDSVDDAGDGDEDEAPDYEGLLSSIVSSAVEEALEKFTKKNGPAPKRTSVEKPNFWDSLFGIQR
jgi:hypothetical protein